MKATLEFNLPEDTEEYNLAINGAKYAIAIEELDNWLRGLAKYEDKETITIEEVRNKIREVEAGLGL